MTNKILIVEDDAGLREALSDTLLMGGYEVVAADSGESALLALGRHQIDMMVSDVQMPGMDGITLLKSVKTKHPNLPVLLMTAYARIPDAVSAMREGALDYMAKPFAPEVLLNLVSRYMPQGETEAFEPVVAAPQSVELVQLAARVAATDASVMVLGPSGSGKEVLARYIHKESPRHDQAFVAINCAAIPDNMLEATLFGYEKGAFTGAVNACPGKFEQAQGGTLLLDEVTEMDLGLQAKLLRVLQEKEVERLGSRKTIKLDVRVIATSNRDLRDAVAQGIFREDLYYRLNVFPLSWKSLKERSADIVPLAEHLLAKHFQQTGEIPALSASARSKLTNYSWPGNVRELENVIQRAIILHQNDQIQAQDLLLEDEPVAHIEPVEEEQAAGLGSELRHQEHQIIIDTLNACNGKRKDVAEKLGISPRTLRYKLARMRDMGIEVPA